MMFARLVVSRAGLHASAKKVSQSTSRVSVNSSTSMKWTNLAVGASSHQAIQLGRFSTSAADQSAGAGKKKFVPRGVEFYQTVDLSEELKAVEADMPTYTDAVIASAVTESESFKKIGKAPPAEICRKIMYSSYRNGDYRQAHSSFLDLQVHAKLTLFEFNLAFVYQTLARDFTKVHETFDMMRHLGVQPNYLSYNVLFKAFSQSGSVGRILYIYEHMFQHGLIPDRSQLECIVQAAAIAGDALTFHYFCGRLNHKGYPISQERLRALLFMWKTASATNDPHLTRMRPTCNDFSFCINSALRAHNYRLAFDLLRECRDTYDIQPDAFMYETILRGLIRDDFLRAESREWKKRFSVYPKGITRREDHFEFAEFLKKVEAHLLEHCKGDAAQLKNIKPTPTQPKVSVKRTTRKMSRQLYKVYTRERYVTPYDAEDDMFEWVPEYAKRRELEPVKKAIELSTETLRAIQDEAHARVAASKAKQQQQAQ